MKHVFKQLNVYRPTTRVGESYKPCQFKTGSAIVDLEHISIIGECVIFESENKLDKEVLDWLEERHLIMANIVLKDGSKITNVVAPNMDYFVAILSDVT